MARRAGVPVRGTTAATFNGAGSQYLVQTPSGNLYCIFIDSGFDVGYRKSTDGGATWQPGENVFVGTATALSVWYDRWSNISAGLIHMAYTESATDDTLYRTINTESSDALSTQTVIFAGTSTAAGGKLSICRAVGGNVYCRTTIDAGAEGGFYRLPNANVPNGAWDAARTIDEANATQDQCILLPDFDAADTQDMMMIFWDASANEISRKLYDDSANTWSETSIAASMVDSVATTAFPHFDAAVDITNTRAVVVAWSAIDTLNADLRCWTVDSGAITEVTNVVQNSTDDQGLCAISINPITGTWWVFYGGATAGGETFPTAMNVYCKGSTDSGSTWGPETVMTLSAMDIKQLYTIPRVLTQTSSPSPCVLYTNGANGADIRINIDRTQPTARSIVGL